MTDPNQLTPTERALKLIGDPEALAKQRLMDFAASLPCDRVETYDDRGEYTGMQDVEGSEVTYSEMMARARAFQKRGEYWSEGGRFEGTHTYEGFWDDYELVTKTKVDPDNKYGFFSCAC